MCVRVTSVLCVRTRVCVCVCVQWTPVLRKLWTFPREKIEISHLNKQAYLSDSEPQKSGKVLGVFNKRPYSVVISACQSYVRSARFSTCFTSGHVRNKSKGVSFTLASVRSRRVFPCATPGMSAPHAVSVHRAGTGTQVVSYRIETSCEIVAMAAFRVVHWALPWKICWRTVATGELWWRRDGFGESPNVCSAWAA